MTALIRSKTDDILFALVVGLILAMTTSLARDAHASGYSGYRKSFSFEYTAPGSGSDPTKVVESGVDTYYDAIRCKPVAAGSVDFGSSTRINYRVGDCTYCEPQLSVPTRAIWARSRDAGTVAMECIGLIK